MQSNLEIEEPLNETNSITIYLAGRPQENMLKLSISGDFENFLCIVRSLIQISDFAEQDPIFCEFFNKAWANFQLDTKSLYAKYGKGCKSGDNLGNILKQILKNVHDVHCINTNGFCKGLCSVHKTFPMFFRKTECECGEFAGSLIKNTQYCMEICAEQLTRPEFSNKKLFASFYAKDVYEMLYFSSAKWQVDAFAPVISNMLSSTMHCPNNPLCKRKTENKVKIKNNFTAMAFSIDWKGCKKNRINIVQVFISLMGNIIFDQIFKGRNEKLGLSSLIVTLPDGKYKSIIKAGKMWFLCTSQTCSRIGNGTLYDVGIYLVYHNAIPEMVFYSSKSLNIPITPLEIAYLERISYKYELDKNTKVLDQEIKYLIKINEIIKYNPEHLCPSCNFEKIRGKRCMICKYLEGEWVCNSCDMLNEPISWTCYCENDRIIYDEVYHCNSCKIVNHGINYCKYCPLLGICINCNKPILPYQAVYCMVCKKVTLGIDECVSHHNVLCKLCNLSEA